MYPSQPVYWCYLPVNGKPYPKPDDHIYHSSLIIHHWIVLNDFVIRFANVNGTGSASANTMFAKAIFRMGIPVSPKNIFPSNIQGLPTWYEVRVSEKGYL